MHSRKAASNAYAEESAEVQVLYANLEKLDGLKRKIQATLTRVEDRTINPIFGDTAQVQVMHNNIDHFLDAIARLRAPTESQDQEEGIIRSRPRDVGLQEYVASLERLDKAHRGLLASNLAANQDAMGNINASIKYGNRQLEEIFENTLKTVTTPPIEPLHNIAKGDPFPTILPPQGSSSIGVDPVAQAAMEDLQFINQYLTRFAQRSPNQNIMTMRDPPAIKIFANLRGTYVVDSLVTLQKATLNTARRQKNSTGLYERGKCLIGSYCQGLLGMLEAEYENIRHVFDIDVWAHCLFVVAGPTLSKFKSTLETLVSHIEDHMLTDCFLSFELLSIVFDMISRLDMLSGELKTELLKQLPPIYNLAKTSLFRLISDVSDRVKAHPSIPSDGAMFPGITADVVSRLQCLCDYQPVLTTILTLIGEGKWLSYTGSWSTAAASTRQFDPATILDLHNNVLTAFANSGFQPTPIFTLYCTDMVDTLIRELDSRARLLLATRPILHAVFMANHLVNLESLVAVAVSKSATSNTNSGVAGLDVVLASTLAKIGANKDKQVKVYLRPWKDLCGSTLFDKTHTSRHPLRRPPSSGASSLANGVESGSLGGGGGGSGAVDSASIVKAMSSKDRDKIRDNFKPFNSQFEDLVSKHEGFKMEPGVRKQLNAEILMVVQPLYDRFWDRYHELTTMFGTKVVKWSKAEVAAKFA